MARDTFIDGNTEPKGKRTVRRSASGGLFGYIGRTKWQPINVCGIDDFSKSEEIAASAWIACREDWIYAPWE